MSYYLQRHQEMHPCLLVLIETPNHDLIANGKMCRLNERPAQILIAFLRVSNRFAFTITGVCSLSTQRQEEEKCQTIVNRLDVAGFHENGVCQDRHDAWTGQRTPDRLRLF